MKRFFALLSITLSMTVLMACSESPTTSNVDATADFNSYKT